MSEFKFSPEIQELAKQITDYPDFIKYVEANSFLALNYLTGSYLKVIPISLYEKAKASNDFSEIDKLIEEFNFKSKLEKLMREQITQWRQR